MLFHDQHKTFHRNGLIVLTRKIASAHFPTMTYMVVNRGDSFEVQLMDLPKAYQDMACPIVFKFSDNDGMYTCLQETRKFLKYFTDKYINK